MLQQQTKNSDIGQPSTGSPGMARALDQIERRIRQAQASGRPAVLILLIDGHSLRLSNTGTDTRIDLR